MGLCLWIVPTSGDSEKLERIMNIRPKNFGQVSLAPKSYPKFHPHITLASLPLAMETNLDAIKNIVQETNRLPTCQFEIVEIGSHYYRSVYIKIKLSSGLKDLHKHVHEALHLEPRTPAFPHLSLCYIDDVDAADGERNSFYDTLQESGKIRSKGSGSEDRTVSLECGRPGEEDWLGQFVAHEIWAVLCEGPVDGWVVLRKFGTSPS